MRFHTVWNVDSYFVQTRILLNINVNRKRKTFQNPEANGSLGEVLKPFNATDLTISFEDLIICLSDYSIPTIRISATLKVLGFIWCVLAEFSYLGLC